MFSFLQDRAPETKNYEQNTQNSAIFLDLFDSFQSSENSNRFLDYYRTASPVSTAVKLITDNALTIPFVLQDTISKEYIYNHPILNLLRTPNEYSSSSLFESEMLSFMLLTGNNYLHITGLKEPTALYNLNPKDVSITQNLRGYAESYIHLDDIFILDKINKEIRSKNSNGKFLAHYRNFNPRNNIYGISELAACEIEIVIYELANIHNRSILKNQGRPSGIISYEGSGFLDDNQINQMTSTLKSSLGGANNAGKPIFLTSAVKWQQLSESVKDMDFSTLHKRTSESIYNTLKIPLPMVSPDNMTLANMDTAKINLFDNVVVPLKTKICEYLTNSLVRRYKNSENLIITFDETEIEVLKTREVKNALDISNSGLLRRDEIRASIGYDKIGDERGDEIVGKQNSAQVPPILKSFKNSEIKTLMSKLKDEKGNMLYSDEFINELLND